MNYHAAYHTCPPPRPPRSTKNQTIWIVLGVIGVLFFVLLVGLAALGAIIGEKSEATRDTTKSAAKSGAPASSGWPMEFQGSQGPPTRSFNEHDAKGAPQRIVVSVHAPQPFLEVKVASFAFEVCKLDDMGERSRWHCDTQKFFVNPAKTGQKDGIRSYTISEGPGVYQARLVEFGTFGGDDEVFSSASFEVH